ncbi:MAG: MFS transporter [Acetobacteraceae bacterium]|nr:MFS transporter [Pseudomonadota bacterium]
MAVALPIAAPIPRRRVLTMACAAHALHDGYTDLIYVLLPVWQAEFGLGYAALGLLRALYTGAMASLQIPASTAARRFGAVSVLALGTVVAAGAYVVIGITGAGFVLLAAALLAGGAGSATQHPLASALVSRAYDEGGSTRTALGTYNFAGDLGKMAVPATLAALMAVLSWRHALGLLGLAGIALAAAIAVLLPARLGNAAHVAAQGAAHQEQAAPRSAGFMLLLLIGVIDSATRMGFLAFLPFVLQQKGAGFETIGLALSLVFAGGAAGKFACGVLSARIGVLATVLLTEGGTAAGIIALHFLPLTASLLVLPLIGLALNGTSSALYGSVPELVTSAQRERAFGIFYTGTIGSGALAPVVYGLVGDATGARTAITVVAVVCLATIPLAVALNPFLVRRR